MTKPSVVSFLITLLLAAAVCTHGIEPVTDTDGNPVQVRQQYFIQPVKTGSNNGGGLVPAAIRYPICPLGITQTSLQFQPGLPVIFIHPGLTTEPEVKIAIDINIIFSSKIWLCNEFSKFWEVDDSSPAILIGGERGSRNSSFKIEKAGEGEGANTYKLTTYTGTVGTVPGIYGGAPQLVITDDTTKPLLVQFKKVDDTTTATTSTSRVEKLGLKMFPFY